MDNTAHMTPDTHKGAAVTTPASRLLAVLPWQETTRRKVSPYEKQQRHGER